MNIWPIVFIASTSFAAIGFVVVAVLWLRKLRDTISTALGETAGQQLRSSQHLHDKLSRLQTRHKLLETRLDDLTAENMKLRKELGQLAGRVQTDEQTKRTNTRLLH